MLLKAKDPTVLARLMKIDYERLAQECATAVPGFRKADLVKVYTEHYESLNCDVRDYEMDRD